MLRQFLLLLLLALGGEVAAGATTTAAKMVSIDCKKAQSINAALADKAEELIIEVHGRCRENVVIARDRVTIRGGDPLEDAIEGLPEAVNGTTIVVRDGRNIRIERLTISGAQSNGISISNSNRLGYLFGPKSIAISNCRLMDSGEFGLRIIDADVSIADTIISGNGLGGIFLHRGVLLGQNCIVQNNPAEAAGSALTLDLGARANFSGSLISGEFSVSVGSGSHFISSDSTLVGTGNALHSRDSDVLLTRVKVVGRIEGRSKSSIVLGGVTQTSNPTGNIFGEDSSFRLVSAAAITPPGNSAQVSTSLNGDLLLLGFSNGVVLGDNSVQGNLICRQGSDVFCDDPTHIIMESVNCRSCVKP